MFKPLTPLQSATNRYLSLYETRIGEDTWRGPEWLRQIRTEAIDQFAEVGFPSTRREEWRFTNVQRIAEKEFVERDISGIGKTLPEDVRRVIDAADGWRIVFRDGEFVPALSDIPPVTSGVYLNSLETSLREQPELVQRHMRSEVSRLFR